MSSHQDGSIRVILLSLGANLGIAVAKFVGAWLSGSAALLAEAIHSVADCTNQVLLLVGNRAARRPPTASHPLGYGRESFFWSFVVALILFSMGGLFAIYEGCLKLRHAEPLERPWLGFAILAVSVVLEAISFRSCLREVRAANPGVPLRIWFRRTTAADLLVIFTEDLAALVGLAIAAACLGLALVTENGTWDAVGSILVGGLLVCVAALLARETKSLLIGEAPAANYEPSVAAIVAQVMPGAQVIRFIALQAGPSQVLLSYKIHPGEIASARQLIEAINEVERRVRAVHPEVNWQFAEPDYAP